MIVPSRVRKQKVVDYFCPHTPIEVVERCLVTIKAQAEGTPTIRSSLSVSTAFKCKCGHDEAYDGDELTCKKCSLVQKKVHNGKEWRDIAERGDMNTAGSRYLPEMSEVYNRGTRLSLFDAKGKKVTAKFIDLGKTHKGNDKYKDSLNRTIDRQILEARAEFTEMNIRLHHGSFQPAMDLFIRFRLSVPQMKNKNIVHAACMFSTIKEPTHKPWKKTFRNKGKFNASKKKRLKMMTFKKRPMVIKKYRE
mgnify:CR=1 FL=1